MSKEWPRVRFGQILRSNSRPYTLAPEEDANLVGMRLYGAGPFHRELKPAMQIAKKTHFGIRAGDVIYNKLFAWKGTFGIVPPQLDSMYVSDKFPTYEMDRTRVDEAFLRWYFRFPPLWEEARQMSTGSAALSKLTLNPPKFLLLTIPLPPLAEQRRVVARIEQLAAQINDARTLRRQAAEEAEALVASETNALLVGEAIDQWLTKSLGEVAEIRSGVTLGRRLTDRTIRLPYLRVANVQDGYLDLAEIKEVEVLESEVDKWKLKRGDLLLTEGGDWDKLGRGTVWREEILDCIHQNHIFRVRTKPDDFVPEFVAKFISSPVGKAYFQQASKQTTNLASINQRQLKAFRIFQPPLPEQRRIVSELDALQAEVDALKRLQASTAAELDALLPAILDKAFKGGF